MSFNTTQPLTGSYATKVCILFYFRVFSKHLIVQVTAVKQSIIHRTIYVGSMVYKSFYTQSDIVQMLNKSASFYTGLVYQII